MYNYLFLNDDESLSQILDAMSLDIEPGNMAVEALKGFARSYQPYEVKGINNPVEIHLN